MVMKGEVDMYLNALCFWILLLYVSSTKKEMAEKWERKEKAS
jgi:hypothetical protein